MVLIIQLKGDTDGDDFTLSNEFKDITQTFNEHLQATIPQVPSPAPLIPWASHHQCAQLLEKM